jgi:hypothetical protein
VSQPPIQQEGMTCTTLHPLLNQSTGAGENMKKPLSTSSTELAVRLRQILFAASTGALLAACGGDSDSPSPPTPVPAPAPVPAPVPAPPSTLSQVTTFLASVDALWATAVPAPATRLSVTDDCFLDDGRTKAFNLTDLTARQQEVAAQDAYRIGERRGNIQVLAERNTTNSDGSTRREVDVQFDITYADGSAERSVRSTVISGSSFGTPRCAAPQNSSALRTLGNQQLIRIEARARNLREENYSLAGVPLVPLVTYRNDVQMFVRDPMGNSTYIIVSGPGPAGAGGQPFSLKLISPRLLRSAPELAGRNGNYLNWDDNETFRFCRVVGPTVPVASVADCVGQGATGNNWGWNTSTPNAAADAGFAGQGWTAGGNYTFAVYNDDGWKTVNGHAGRTPIATYTTTLKRLPYTFVEMAGSGPATDNFPRFTAPTPPSMASNLVSAAPTPMNVTWSGLPTFANTGGGFRLFSIYEYFEGPKSTNPMGAFYPAYRSNIESYPGSTAVAVTGLVVGPTLADMTAKSYAEFGLVYLDRNDSLIFSIISFD